MKKREKFDDRKSPMAVYEVHPGSWMKHPMGNVDENAEVNENLIATAVMDDFFFVKAKNESRVSVDFRKYALDESLKGFFIRLVEEDDEIDEETKGQIVRMGLRALSGEEIIQ